MADKGSVMALVHADESCLGNGLDGSSPGGAASFIETWSAEGVERRDIHISAPDSTNNRMALSGAIATFALLSQEYERLTVVYVSDSQYLIKGMNEWVPSWRARGWKRKGGAVENLKLWKKLVQVAERHQTVWRWVRGHAGHPKNEYVNDLAMKAAAEQTFSEGLEKSLFDQWLARQRAVGHFTDYDPDTELAEIEGELASKP